MWIIIFLVLPSAFTFRIAPIIAQFLVQQTNKLFMSEKAHHDYESLALAIALDIISYQSIITVDLATGRSKY